MNEKYTHENYVVVANDNIVGHFSHLDQAVIFMHITALHSDIGDKIYLYRVYQMIEVVE